MSERVLFLGLARRSTGELTYSLRLLVQLLGSSRFQVDLCINPALLGTATGYGGMIRTHRLDGLPFTTLMSELESLTAGYQRLVFIDLNCFLLESNLRRTQLDALLRFLSHRAASGTIVACMDYFGSILETDEEIQVCLTLATHRLENKIHGLPVLTRTGYYLRKFLPERMKLQIFPRPQGIEVLRPVPLNRRESVHPHYHPFANDLGTELRTPSLPSSGHALLALSRFFEYTVEPEVLKNLCGVIMNGLIQHCGIREITCVDPFGIIEPNYPGVTLRVERWMNGKEMEHTIDRSDLVGLMVPYGTVGTLALTRGVPFFSFYASQSTMQSPVFGDRMKQQTLPGFNGLGVWEDEAFYPELAINNPCFTAVTMVDLCEPESFSLAGQELDTGICHARVLAYQNWIRSLSLPPFLSVMLALQPTGEPMP